MAKRTNRLSVCGGGLAARPLALAAVVMVGVVGQWGCSAEAPSVAAERTAAASAAVVGGYIDHENRYGFVGKYGFAVSATQSTLCSGILITPAWVLSARHCIMEHDGDPADFRNRDTDVEFPPNSVQHTLKDSGPILVREAAQNNIWSNDSVSKDLALIPLDKLVDRSVATPIHVPGVGPDLSEKCSQIVDLSGFSATLVGFGGASKERNYRASEGWALKTADPGNVYQNAWFVAQYGLADGSSEGGDSGGALLRNDVKLCGVTSGHLPGVLWHGTCPACYPEPVFYSMTVAVDSSDAVGWISSNIVDLEGRLMGECLEEEVDPLADPARKYRDSDEDLLPDACDPCWNKKDEKYRESKRPAAYVDPITHERTGLGCCSPAYFKIPGVDPSLADKDSDNDGIPDLCDTCPYKANPSQTKAREEDTDADGVPNFCDTCPDVATVIAGMDQSLVRLVERVHDSDHDGVGDVCDWCNGPAPADQPGMAGQVLANCNLEAELILNYPGLSDPPVIRADSPTYVADVAKYKAAFKIGSCETAPCPSADLSEEGGGFPPGQEPEFQCVTPEAGYCYFANGNIIFHQPEPAAGAQATQNGLGTTHMKWCDCEDVDVENRAGRESCAQQWGCSRMPQQFLDQSKWRDIRAAKFDTDSDTWDWANAGPARNSLPFTGNIELRTMWDYRALGSPFVKNKNTGLPYVEGVDGALSPSVNGILWNSTREGFGYAPSSAEESALHERASYFESGAARVTTRGKMYDPVQIPNWDLDMDMPCYTCGKLGVGDLILAGPLGGEDPTWLVGENGVKPAPGLLSDDAKSALLSAVASKSAIVQAAEPLGVVETRFTQMRTTRVAMINPSTPMQVTSLETTSLSSPVDTGCGSSPTHCDRQMVSSRKVAAAESVGLDTLMPEEGLVLSSSRQQLYRFGGLVQSVPSDHAWILDLPTDTWTRQELAAGYRPGAVVAGTFRINDGRLYAIDRGPNGSFSTLRAWVPGTDRFQEIGRFPPAWKAFSRYWLVTNERGDLFLIATRKSRSAIARLAFSASGMLEFKGLWFTNETIVARPYAGDTGLGITVPEAGGTSNGPAVRQRVIDINQLKDKPNGWIPSIGN